ncbi:MAG: cysteine desulfurase [Ignavibacteria bacterium]|nr:cysteine desulfurase [Ignavibacteria bacterium]
MNDFNVNRIREDFPILHRKIRGRQLVYFDNAATSQKPLSVIETVSNYYKTLNSNVHRGVHFLSDEATNKYEEAREKVRSFINASSVNEIIFVRGTTEAINLIATSYGNSKISRDDEIIISALEHHSNIVPWQMLCERTGAKLKVIPINDKGEILFDEFEKLITEKTKLISVIHISNALGTINPIKEIIEKAHSRNIPVLIDGAQSTQHCRIDVKELDCDFFAFSGHKIFGPTGIGVLYGKEKLLDEMPPYHGGGEMIESVSFEKTIYNKLPYKFEAGTPDISGPIGLASAIDYINKIGIDNISNYENKLLEYGTTELMKIGDLRIIGTAENKASVISFLAGNLHPYDVGTILDHQGIAIRTGHHCAEPLMKRLGISGTARVSFAFYNTKEEIDLFITALRKAIKMLK